jgi:hypothetical protein
MLQGWVALDSQNNRTTIRLSNQRFNAARADGAFRWNDPRRGRESQLTLRSCGDRFGIPRKALRMWGGTRDFPPVARNDLFPPA